MKQVMIKVGVVSSFARWQWRNAARFERFFFMRALELNSRHAFCAMTHVFCAVTPVVFLD